MVEETDDEDVTLASAEESKQETEDESDIEEEQEEIKDYSGSSGFDFDIELDPAIKAAIENSLANTPHDGFKPIVSISPNGKLKIDFVPI